MAFWHWKKEPTLAEQAVSAVDRISQDISDLRAVRAGDDTWLLPLRSR